MSVSARRAFPGLGQQWRWGPRLPQFRTTTRAKLLSRWSLPTLQQLFGRSARRTTLTEGEIIPCTAANVKLSHVGQDLDARLRLYEESIASPEKFWASIAKSDYHWEKLWEDDSKVLSYNFHRSKGPISVKWFEGGVTNMCYNCLDRHLPAHKDRVCFYSEGNETSHVQTLTYGNMYTEVVQIANILKNQYGIKKGDCVSIYLPMVPFAVAAMLACARIGAVTSVVFAGFSAQALAARMTDANAKLLITADASARGAKPIYLKQVVDEAYDDIETEVPCLVYENFQRQHCTLKDGRDTWYSDALARLSVEEREKCPIEWVDAEDPLFMLYTSGSTGAPKALLHTTAGYMVYAGTTFKYSFDYHPEDVYFCTADIGWITGHTYVAYGPMLHCATSVIHEGLPVYPTASRWWEMVDRYKVSIFYTAPTAIRALMQQGDEHVKKCNLSSLRVLGSVGEPINVEAWRWYHDLVGNGHADVADTWWQTETGGHLITPLPGCTPQKPGSATLPFFGVVPVILDSQSTMVLEGAASGLLAIEKPWPGLARTIFKDHERYEKTYFHVDGVYLTGDGARRDHDGYYWITGRVDDVLNVSGHRIGTSEVENAVNFHPAVVESAVVGVHHDVKGESIYVFVTFHKDVEVTAKLMGEVKAKVREIIGPLATPDFIQSAQCGLPKTRSGKIVRRILRKIAAGTVEDLGDTSTLSDPAVVPALIEEKGQWVKGLH